MLGRIRSPHRRATTLRATRSRPTGVGSGERSLPRSDGRSRLGRRAIRRSWCGASRLRAGRCPPSSSTWVPRTDSWTRRAHSTPSSRRWGWRARTRNGQARTTGSIGTRTSARAYAGSPRASRTKRNDKLQPTMTQAARHRMWGAPPRGQLERLLGAAVGAGAARLDHQVDRAEPLEELPGAIGEERRNEHEVRDGDEDGEHGDARTVAEPGQGATHALGPVEFTDRHATGGGLAVVAAQQHRLRARRSG